MKSREEFHDDLPILEKPRAERLLFAGTVLLAAVAGLAVAVMMWRIIV